MASAIGYGIDLFIHQKNYRSLAGNSGGIKMLEIFAVRAAQVAMQHHLVQVEIGCKDGVGYVRFNLTDTGGLIELNPDKFYGVRTDKAEIGGISVHGEVELSNLQHELKRAAEEFDPNNDRFRGLHYLDDVIEPLRALEAITKSFR